MNKITKEQVNLIINGVILFVGLLILITCILLEFIGLVGHSIVLFGSFCFIVYKEYQRCKK